MLRGDILETKNIIKAESVVPHKPVQTTQAHLGRHFTHMHYTPFSQHYSQAADLNPIFQDSGSNNYSSIDFNVNILFNLKQIHVYESRMLNKVLTV